MNLPQLNGVRLPLFTLSALLLAALLWWWQPREAPAAAPFADWAQLQQGLLEPLAQSRLTLADLHALADGELWLQQSGDAARLLYRGSLPAAEAQWRLQAELELSASELNALASRLPPGDAVRLPEPMLQSLLRVAVGDLLLEAEPAPTAAAWQAAVGEPRLRLPLSPAEAWVYPPRGLTAHVQDGQVRRIHQVPARTMRGNPR